MRQKMNPELNLANLEQSIKVAKEQLMIAYEQKGETDKEVLRLGEEVDRLLNEYQRLLVESEFQMEAVVIAHKTRRELERQSPKRPT